MLNIIRPSELTDDHRVRAVVSVSPYGACYSFRFWDDDLSHYAEALARAAAGSHLGEAYWIVVEEG